MKSTKQSLLKTLSIIRTFSISTFLHILQEFKKLLVYFSMITFSGLLFAGLPKLYVVTTSEDLASIARQIGKDKVEVESLTNGSMDLHFVPAQPNFIVKANRADVFIEVGLDLEVGWSPRVLQQARNTNILPGQNGYCVAFQGVDILLPPQQEVNRSMGDLHVQGNPHYWPDPLNGIIIAKNIRDTLIRVDRANDKYYQENYQKFTRQIKNILVANLKLLAPHKGEKLISYHQEFDYLVNRYKMSITDNIEEKPGVLPSPARIRYMIDYIRKNKIKVVLVSPWSNIAIARQIANESGAKLLVLPIQTGASDDTDSYLNMLKVTGKLLAEALKK